MDQTAEYRVRDVEGVDPVVAVLTSTSMAQIDGAQPQNARRDVRNITMKVGLKPDYSMHTVQSLRSSLYEYLLPKAMVQLGFYLDGVLFAITSGQVESVDNVLFSQDPEVDTSILCYDPDFYAPTPEVFSTHTQSDNLTTSLIEYAGTSDAGFIFALNVNRTLTSFSVANTTLDGLKQKLEVIGSFIPGDIVTVNTIPGSKAVTLTRAGITTSVLYYKTSVSTWPILKKGDNLLGVYSSGAGIPYTVTYTPKFGGL